MKKAMPQEGWEKGNFISSFIASSFSKKVTTSLGISCMLSILISSRRILSTAVLMSSSLVIYRLWNEQVNSPQLLSKVIFLFREGIHYLHWVSWHSYLFKIYPYIERIYRCWWVRENWKTCNKTPRFLESSQIRWKKGERNTSVYRTIESAFLSE